MRVIDIMIAVLLLVVAVEASAVFMKVVTEVTRSLLGMFPRRLLYESKTLCSIHRSACSKEKRAQRGHGDNGLRPGALLMTQGVAPWLVVRKCMGLDRA